jgi:hypothetical protein
MEVSEKTRSELLIQRGFSLQGFNCFTANVMTPTPFNIMVCTSRFSGKDPFIKRILEILG